MTVRRKARSLLAGVAFLVLCHSRPAGAATVVIIGDIHLKPVADTISGIGQTLHDTVRTYSPGEAQGGLPRILEKEGAQVVIALGRDALDAALTLPPGIPLVYGLVVLPPAITRPQTTGIYMAIPVRNYTRLLRAQFPSLKRIAFVAREEQMRVLDSSDPQIVPFRANNAFEFVNALKKLDDVDAILLPPDPVLLTEAATEGAYLESFRRKLPLLGISEKYVRRGALLALVFDPVGVGKQIGEYASMAVRGLDLAKSPPSPPRRLDLYINEGTAAKMGIQIPEEVARSAKGVFR